MPSFFFSPWSSNETRPPRPINPSLQRALGPMAANLASSPPSSGESSPASPLPPKLDYPSSPRIPSREHLPTPRHLFRSTFPRGAKKLPLTTTTLGLKSALSAIRASLEHMLHGAGTDTRSVELPSIETMAEMHARYVGVLECRRSKARFPYDSRAGHEPFSHESLAGMLQNLMATQPRKRKEPTIIGLGVIQDDELEDHVHGGTATTKYVGNIICCSPADVDIVVVPHLVVWIYFDGGLARFDEDRGVFTELAGFRGIKAAETAGRFWGSEMAIVKDLAWRSEIKILREVN